MDEDEVWQPGDVCHVRLGGALRRARVVAVRYSSKHGSDIATVRLLQSIPGGKNIGDHIKVKASGLRQPDDSDKPPAPPQPLVQPQADSRSSAAAAGGGIAADSQDAAAGACADTPLPHAAARLRYLEQSDSAMRRNTEAELRQRFGSPSQQALADAAPAVAARLAALDSTGRPAKRSRLQGAKAAPPAPALLTPDEEAERARRQRIRQAAASAARDVGAVLHRVGAAEAERDRAEVGRADMQEDEEGLVGRAAQGSSGGDGDGAAAAEDAEGGPQNDNLLQDLQALVEAHEAENDDSSSGKSRKGKGRKPRARKASAAGGRGGRGRKTKAALAEEEQDKARREQARELARFAFSDDDESGDEGEEEEEGSAIQSSSAAGAAPAAAAASAAAAAPPRRRAARAKAAASAQSEAADDGAAAAAAEAAAQDELDESTNAASDGLLEEPELAGQGGWNPEQIAMADDDDDQVRPDFPFPPTGPDEDLVLQAGPERYAVPATINRYLRKYQREGIQFMFDRVIQNSGVILGDDMGLGKTIQVIGLLAALMGKTGHAKDDALSLLGAATGQVLSKTDPVIIVAPASVLYNWRRELELWGYFRVAMYNSDTCDKLLAPGGLKNVDAIIMSYYYILEHSGHFQDRNWLAIVCDEAHRIKNSNAQLTRTIKLLTNIHKRIALTGTALQNRFDELWCLSDWVNPGLLGTVNFFEKFVVQPIKAAQLFDASVRDLRLGRVVRQMFTEQLQKFFLRRTKESEIKAQLPRKEEIVIFCPMTAMQEAIYRTLLKYCPEMDLVRLHAEPCPCRSGRSRGSCCFRFSKNHHPRCPRDGRCEGRDNGGGESDDDDDDDDDDDSLSSDSDSDLPDFDELDENLIDSTECFDRLKLRSKRRVKRGKRARAKKEEPQQDEMGGDAAASASSAPASVDRDSKSGVKNEDAAGAGDGDKDDGLKKGKSSRGRSRSRSRTLRGSGGGGGGNGGAQGGHDPECLSWRTLVFVMISILQKLSNHLGLLFPYNERDQTSFIKALNISQIAFKNHQSFLEEAGRASLLAMSSPDACGKMNVLRRLLPIWAKAGDKVLLFSYSVKLLNIIESQIMSIGMDFLRLDGSTPAKDRLDLCDKFNRDPTMPIMLISTLAGGVGINLQSANIVVIFDPHWNPSHDLQAQDRAYRIGQQRDVKVYRLISAGSIEEMIYARQIYKQQLANIGHGKNEPQRRIFNDDLIGLEKLFTFRDKTTRPLLQRIIERNELAEGYAIGKFQLDFSPEAQAKLKKAEAAAAAAAAGGGRQRADSPTALEDRVDEVLEECGVSYVHDHTKVLDNTAAERALDAHLAQAADSDKRIFDLDSNITVFEKALERNKYEPMEDDELVKRTGKKRVGASRQRKRKASPGPGTDSPDDSVPKLIVPENSNVLVGQTPERIRQRQLEQMSKFFGFASALEFSKYVLSEKPSVRVTLLNNFYSRT